MIRGNAEQHGGRRWCLLAGLATAVLAAGCFESGGGVDPYVVAPRTSSSFSVRGTVEQIYVWNAEPETALEVVAPGGEVVQAATTDHLGAFVFRLLSPGDEYMVRRADDPADYTGPVTVLSIEGSQPDDAFYESQVLVEGYQYLTMRDGTTLAANVYLPGPPEDGPYPTIVNYSGYTPSRPGQSLGEEVEPFCGDYPVLCNAPNHPSGMLAGLMGYASVGVNMRGTACSGGAYDYFEPLQLLDGYDIIEIVSRQSWVKHHQVGMSGLSFPGITQLFVASTRPPGLAAITPMSVIADTASSCLAPGGIYNDGFALSWIENVLNRAAAYEHGWVRDRIDAGDTVCAENQLLHDQRLDAVTKALENPYYNDEVAKPVDPSNFVHVIDVPVYLSGQLQDEQTGPHFPALFDKFTGAPVRRFTATNGVHPDGFAPQNLVEWKIFLDLYVSREVPHVDDDIYSLAPMFMQMWMGAWIDLPPNRFADYTSYDQARADFEAEPEVRIIFESGADPATKPGAPEGTFEARLDAWPVPGTEARRLYFQPDGSLAATSPGPDGGASAFTHDPEAGQRVTLSPGANINDLQPDYDYRPLVDGKAVAWESAPLTETLVLVGSGSVDLWLRSTADDADLEVNLTEVRPDGMESYVQSGWLRASHRKLRDDATELRPVKTHYEQDAAPLVAGEWNEVRVEIMPISHIFRAGSRIRISVDTPGDSRAWWKFILLDQDPPPTHAIAHAAAHPSSVVLPVVPGIDVPTELPDCHALRGQPCREYAPLDNPPWTGAR